MKKGVKKGIIIGGAIIGFLIVALFSVPLLFKDKIKDKIVNVANERLNANLNVSDFALSPFSNFPNITFSLENMSLSGVDRFEGDTLVKAKSVDLTLNLIDVLAGNFYVSEIDVDEAKVYAKILADGSANWNILKKDTSEVQNDEKTDQSKGGSVFGLRLKKISVQNSKVIYEDQSRKMQLCLSDCNGQISGDFTARNTTLKVESTIGDISFATHGITCLSKTKGIADATIDVDIENKRLTFTESNIRLNDLKTSIEGTFAFVKDKGKEFDLKLKSEEIEVKDILSILPAMHTDDFEKLEASGTALLGGSIKGLMQGDTCPAFDFKLLIQDAMFRYPSLPRSVDNINVDVAISNSGGSLDSTIINNAVNFRIGDNTFSAGLTVTTPISDADWKVYAKGLIDLAMIEEVYPLEKDIELKGNFDANVDLSVSKGEGSLKLTDALYRRKGALDVLVNNAVLDFDSQYGDLSSLDVQIGENEFSVTGRFENIMSYLFKDEMLSGNLQLKSKLININDFIKNKSVTTAQQSSEKATSVSALAKTSKGRVDYFVIPANVDLILDADVSHVVFDRMDIADFKGTIAVKSGAFKIQDVSANLLGGTIHISATYNTLNHRIPKVDLDLNLSKISFSETYKSIEAIQRVAPIFDKLKGDFSVNINLAVFMRNNVSRMLSSLTANGFIQSDEVQVEGVEALSELSQSLKTDALKSFIATDINIPFTINRGKINTKLFSINIGDGGKLNLEGTAGVDQVLDYKGSITLPKNLSNNLMNNIPLSIGGTFSNPQISVDTKGVLGNFIGVMPK